MESEAISLRERIERYQSLQKLVSDSRARQVLSELIHEAQQKLDALKPAPPPEAQSGGE